MASLGVDMGKAGAGGGDGSDLNIVLLARRGQIYLTPVGLSHSSSHLSLMGGTHLNIQFHAWYHAALSLGNTVMELV